MVRHAELKEQADSLFLEDQRSGRLWRSASRTWSSTGFRKRTKETRDKERMFLKKAARRSVNVTACVSGRASDEGADPKNSRSNPVPHTKKIGSCEKPWPVIAASFEITGALELRRAVRRLREVLKSEGIRIPIPEDYGRPRGSKMFF